MRLTPSLIQPACACLLAVCLIFGLAGCGQPKASDEEQPDQPASTPFSRALGRTDAAVSDLEQRSAEQQQQVNRLQDGGP